MANASSSAKNFSIDLKFSSKAVDASLVHRVCEFYKVFHRHLAVFPKTTRILGQKIESTTLEILELSLAASYLPKYQKLERVRKVSEKIDLLKYLVRLAHETDALQLKKYLELEKQILEMGRMVGGWINYLNDNK